MEKLRYIQNLMKKLILNLIEIKSSNKEKSESIEQQLLTGWFDAKIIFHRDVVLYVVNIYFKILTNYVNFHIYMTYQNEFLNK